MTAVVCWERRVGPLSELVIASDSRLGGGQRWDSCPKVFPTGRSDVVFAFAGNTLRAYPMVLQALATVNSYQAAARGDLDITDFASHLANALNHMLAINKGPAAEEPPECEFLMAGWSWRLGKFRAYPIRFQMGTTDKGERERMFIASIAGAAPPGLGGEAATPVYATIGDAGRKVTGALARIAQGRSAPVSLDMEPLSVLADICADADLSFDSVGGPPQMAKVYRTMRTELFATAWKGSLCVSGRPLMTGENHDLRIVEADSQGSWAIKSA